MLLYRRAKALWRSFLVALQHVFVQLTNQCVPAAVVFGKLRFTLSFVLDLCSGQCISIGPITEVSHALLLCHHHLPHHRLHTTVGLPVPHDLQVAGAESQTQFLEQVQFVFQLKQNLIKRRIFEQRCDRILHRQFVQLVRDRLKNFIEQLLGLGKLVSDAVLLVFRQFRIPVDSV